MFSFIRRMLKFAGEYADGIRGAFVVSFFDGIFANVPIVVLLLVIMKILDSSIT